VEEPVPVARVVPFPPAEPLVPRYDPLPPREIPVAPAPILREMPGERDPLETGPEPAERWIEEASGSEPPEESGDRGPALWRRRPARHLRLPDRYDDFRLDGRNPLDIPTFLRKQMD
jgi:hypothetical protein